MALSALLGGLGKVGNAVSSFMGGGGGDIVKLVSELAGRKKANTAISQSNVPTEAESQVNALYQELLNPDSPLIRRLSEEARVRNTGDFQSQIRDMQLADRRNVKLGRTPTFFNPERADEAVNFLTSRGLPRVNAMAEDEARQRILEAASGVKGLAGAQQQRLNTTRDQAISQSAYQSQVPNRIWDILSGLQRPASPPIRPSGPILWNDQADKNGIIWNQKRY